jgi:uncharacterized repeat protein (TIGR03803 family)
MKRHLGLFLFVLLASFISIRSTAQTFSTILTFQQPLGVGALTVDGLGNLYGTTGLGGKHNSGVVFELAKPTSVGGAYTFSVLHDFDGTTGGALAGNLLLDTSGNFYGTAVKGGTVTSSCPSGCGIVFKLDHPSHPGQPWKFSVLYSFQGSPTDGQDPYYLSLGSQGALYGTTGLGGAGNVGTVYQLTPTGLTWSESLLFDSSPQNLPCNPPGPLTFDSSGNIFFTTELGGTANEGCVIELTPPTPPATTWASTVIFNFGAGTGGRLPVTPLLMNASGELFGVTLYGGAYAEGSLFNLAHSSGGWREHLLYSFGLPIQSGYWPFGLVAGRTPGTYYGAAIGGGYCNFNCDGTIYELSQSGGSWSQSVVYTFRGLGDGSIPNILIKDSQGTLYGYGSEGGYTGNGCPLGCGTIFKISF